MVTLFYLVLALGMSFLCSLSEAVLLTVRPSFIALMQRSGHLRSGQILKKIKENIDRSLSAILTINTIANTAGAAIVGAQIHELYSRVSLTTISFGLTFLFLVCSEIIPKTIGAAQWRRLAPPVAYIVQVMIYASYPVVVSVDFFSRKFSASTIHPRMTREELVIVAEMGQVDGTLLEKEARVIKNLLYLNRVKVRDVMTPRSVVFALSRENTVGKVITEIQKSFFSRIPVFDKSFDNVVGVVFRTLILQASADDHTEMPLEKLMVPVHTVLETDAVATCLDQFIKRREHLFLVRSGAGKIIGIVTLEDAIETLLGVEIVDEVDKVVDMRKLADENNLSMATKDMLESERCHRLA